MWDVGVRKGFREKGLSWGLSGKESACQCRRHGFDPWVWDDPTLHGASKPMTTTTEPVLSSLRAATTEALHLRACALQPEKPKHHS